MSKLIPLQVVDSGAMYASAAKIYPRETDGRLQRLRIAAVFWLLGMFYAFPWINWSGRQIVLFDLPARKFYVFGLAFWPQDFFYLAMLLMIAAFTLFFFTALAGRLWCGYACPQTVWTEVFLWMERWTEGTRNQRIKLDAAPWTRNKLLRKSAKQILWVSFALWTGFTFVGFFTPIRTLAHEVIELQLGGWEIFWILFYALATYGNAGYLREQVCKYMCPYARFQGAMFDGDTLIIAYDEPRGEPRGPRGKNIQSVLTNPTADDQVNVIEVSRDLSSNRQLNEASLRTNQQPKEALLRTNQQPKEALLRSNQQPKEALLRSNHPTKEASAPFSEEGSGGFGDKKAEGASPQPQSPLGDCVACTICVQVCPTGIDIRDGLQYECIACGACVDACDTVMDKVGYPRGLIRYSTLNAISGKPTRVLRPRIVIYAAILVLLLGTFAWSVSHRVPLIVDVLRDRNALFRSAADGGIENSYTLKVMNKDQRAHRYRIAVRSDLALAIVSSQPEFEVAAEHSVEIPLTLRAASGAAHGAKTISVTVQSQTAAEVSYTQETRFFGPQR